MILDNIGFSRANELKEDLDIPGNIATDLNYIAERLTIKVIHKNLGEGIEGACKSNGIKRLVFLKPNQSYLQKERFTLSHEIGHLLIHHCFHLCRKEYFNTYKTQNDKEQEANDFAVELLLPRREMLDILRHKDLTFEVIKKVASQYNTSFSVAAIQLTKLFNDNAALIWHDGQRITWKVLSSCCFLRISNAISPYVLAHKTSAERRDVTGKIHSQHWIDNDDSDLICEEETHYFVNLKYYLTILKFYKEDY